jgi:hypothetical protein
MDEYMKTDLFASIHKVQFFKNVEFEIHENLAGGELCADLGVWPVSKGKVPVCAEDLKDAWLLVPRFHIKPEVVSLDDFKGMLAEGATAPWTDLPGLRNKYFTLYGKDNMGAGFYTFTSRERLDDYLKTNLWAGMTQQPHLDNLTYKVCEIL